MSITSSDAKITAGGWHHVSFTYNKFTSTVNLFVNNVLVGSANDVHIDLTKTNADFAVGYDIDNATNETTHFKGAVDNIQIYNRELSGGEVAYLADTTNTELFLKNQLVGHWSFEQFTTLADNFMDQSTFGNTSTVASGSVTHGSQSTKGNTSVVFDGASILSAPNDGFNTNYMSASAWVKPTSVNTTFVQKDGVFSLGLNANGLPDLKIGSTDTTNLKFLKNLNNTSLKSHLTFEQNVTDSVGYTQAVSTNTTFQADSYNPSVGGSSMVLDGVNSYVNTGKILENINDPNQMTMGMWVNLQDLEAGNAYPLVSVNNGFEWWIDKYGDNAKLNFYQPGVVEFSIGDFTVADNVGTGEIVITTDTNKTYSVALFSGELDMTNVDDVNKFKTIAVTVTGSITADAGVEQTIPFTLSTIYNYDDLTANTLDKVNNGYLYVSVAGGELNESRVLVKNVVLELGGLIIVENVNATTNSSLVMDKMVQDDVVFDYSTVGSTYTSQDRHLLGIVTFENGDKFYGPWVGGSTFATLNIGYLFNISTSKGSSFNRPNDSKMDNTLTTPAGRFYWYYYYEPVQNMFANQLLIHTTYVLAGLITHLESVDVVIDGVRVPVTNTSITLPFQITNTNYTSTPLTVNFDNTLIGPNRPLKFTFKQNNDSHYFNEFYINGSIPILTPVINQTATYRPFENDIQLSGTIFSSHNSFTKVYNPLVFANDVDAAILTEEYLKAYVSNPDNNVGSTDVDYKKDLVNAFDGITVDKAINANGDLIDLVDEDANYNIYVIFEDNVGESHIGENLSFVVNQTDLLVHLDFFAGDVTDQSQNGYTVELVGTTNSTINGYGSKSVLNDGDYIEIPSVSWTENEQWTVAVVLEVLAVNGSNYFHIAYRGAWSIELDRLQLGGTNITVSQFNDVVGFKGILLAKQDGKNLVRYTVYNLEDGSVFSQQIAQNISYDNTSNVLGTSDYTSPNFIMVGAGIKTEEVSKAKYGEVIVYNRFFNDFEESRLVSHLQRKWTTGKISYVLPTLSTLRSPITTSQVTTEGITLESTITPDENNLTTTYYALATTKTNLTNDEVRTMMKDPTYADAVVTVEQSLVSDLDLNITIPKMIDMSNYIVPSSSTNYANVYLHATDGNPEHDDIDKFTIAPDVPGMYITAKAEYYRFDEKVYVSGTLFTSDTKNIVKVYYAVFSMDADLTDEATVKTFLETNGTSQDITVLPYYFGQTNTFIFGDAFTDLTNNLLKTTILPEVSYEVRMMSVDVDGGYVMGKPEYNSNGLIYIKDVDWSQQSITTPDYDLSMEVSGGYYGGDCGLTTDGKVAHIATFLYNNVNGHTWLWYFNDETNQWGKYNTDGTFTASEAYKLIRPTGRSGRYGESCKMSGDGKTVCVGNYIGSKSGEAYMWHYDDATYTWGKYDSNGVFLPGEPHVMFMTGTVGGIGLSCSISADGKTVLFSASEGSNGAASSAFVWKYNELTYTWGKFNSDNTFTPTTPYDLTCTWTTIGKYGYSDAISSDGKNVVIGGSHDNGSGCLWVWQYNDAIHAWGKYTESGFVAGTESGFKPHDLSKASGAGGNYGYKCSVSADGKVVFTAGVTTSSSTGCGWVWLYDESTYTWGYYNSSGTFVSNDGYNISYSGIRFGMDAEISADGRTAISSAYTAIDGGGAVLWQFDDSSKQWGKYLNDGSFVPYTEVGFIPHDLSMSSGAKGYYGLSSTMSADGSTALICGYREVGDGGGAWIRNGIDNGIKEILTYSGSKASQLSFPTTIKTTITSTKQTDEGIVFSGEVIPDSTNETTYYAIATTTNDLTIEQIRDIANNTNYDYSYALTPVVVPTTLTLTDQLIPYVLDTTTAEPYAIAHSVSTGYANVYLYATDGVDKHDDIDTTTIDLIQEQVDSISTKSLYVPSNILLRTTSPLDLPSSLSDRPVGTFSCWVNVYDNLTADEGFVFSLISEDGNADATHRSLVINSTGLIIRSGIVHNVPHTFTLDTWYHICVVFANESVRLDAQKVYIDGIYNASTETSTNIATYTVANPKYLHIGGHRDGIKNKLNATLIDNFKVFDTSLTSVEVLQLFNTDTVTAKSPIVHHTFNTLYTETEITNNGDVKYNFQSPLPITLAEHTGRSKVLVTPPTTMTRMSLITDQILTLPIANSRPTTTISFWLKLTIPKADVVAAASGYTLFSFSGATGARTFKMVANSSAFAFQVNAGYFQDYDTIVKDTWYHICLVFLDDATIDLGQKVYVNGTILIGTNTGAPDSITSPLGKLEIGGGKGYLLDDFMVFNSVLSNSDISALSSRQSIDTVPIIHQRFDSVTDGVFIDKYNNNFNMIQNTNKYITTVNDVPPQPAIDYNPRVTVPIAIYSPFHDTVKVSGAVFSAQDNVITVYPPVAFKDDVNLSDVEALKTFFATYVTPTNVASYTFNHIEQFNDILLQTAYTDLSGTTEAIVEGEQYNVRMYALTDDVQRWAIGAPISFGAMNTYDRLFHMDIRDPTSYDDTNKTVKDVVTNSQLTWIGTNKVTQDINAHRFIHINATSSENQYLQTPFNVSINNYSLSSFVVVKIMKSDREDGMGHIFTHGNRDFAGHTMRYGDYTSPPIDYFQLKTKVSILEPTAKTTDMYDKLIIICMKQFYNSSTDSFASGRIVDVNDGTEYGYLKQEDVGPIASFSAIVEDKITIGTATYSTVEYGNMSIGELIMYAGMLNEYEELSEIERLRNKWKVGGSAKSAGVSYLSALRTSVTSVSSLPNEEIKFTGSLIPDATYDTTYYVVATTVKNLTDEQVRELVMNPDYAEGVKTGVVLPADGTLVFTDEPLPNVIDTSTSAPYTIHSSKSVNTAHVYMYAKDAYTGVKVHDDIDYIELTTTETGPRVYVPTVVYRPFENDVTVSGITAFSKNLNISKVYDPIVFAEDVDIDILTPAYLKQYVIDNSINSSNIVSYQSNNIHIIQDYNITKVIKADNSVEDMNEEFLNKYKLYVLVEDDVTNVGIGENMRYSNNITNVNLIDQTITVRNSFDIGTMDEGVITDTIVDIVSENTLVGTGEVIMDSDGHKYIMPTTNIRPTISTGFDGQTNCTHVFVMHYGTAGRLTISLDAGKGYTVYIDTTQISFYPYSDIATDLSALTTSKRFFIIFSIGADPNYPTSHLYIQNQDDTISHSQYSHPDTTWAGASLLDTHFTLESNLHGFYEYILLNNAYLNDNTNENYQLIWQYLEDKYINNNGMGSFYGGILPSASTLRTTIESATLTDTLTFTGEVIPDSENATTYYALATIDDLSYNDARTMIGTYPDAVVSVANITSTTTLMGIALPSVLDTTNSIVSSSLVNYANVYLYATDGDITHDDITRFEIVPSEDVPHVVVSTAQYYPFENYILVSGSAFSYNSSVATIHVSAFDPSVDLAGQTETQIKDYIVANTTGTSLVVNQKIVGDFTNVEINSVFTDLVGGTTTMTDGMKYDVRVVVVDALGAKGMGQFVDKSGYLSVRDVDWSGLVVNEPTYTLSKVSPPGDFGGACALSADGKIALITGYDSGNISGCGYVFRLVDGSWLADDFVDVNNTLNSSRLTGAHTDTTLYSANARGRYGMSCDISSNGSVALITGYGDTTFGCGYVWRNVDGIWQQDGILNSSLLSGTFASSTLGQYGMSCALSADGTIALISGYNTDTSGCAYVWRYINGTWSHTENDVMNQTGTDGFYGWSCSLSADGNTVLVAGPRGGIDGGCGYIYRYDGSVWVLDTSNLDKLTPGYYGNSCSLSADGNIAVISGYIDTTSGCAILWRFNENSGIWEHDVDNDDLGENTTLGRYGTVCDISSDGNTVLVAGDNTTVSGCAYIHEYNSVSGTWTVKNISHNASTGEYSISCSISSDGSTIVLGSPNLNAYIWQGTVDTNSPVTLVPFITPSAFQSASTLRASVASATLTDTLTFTGEVIPDSENATTYYAMATIEPIANEADIRTMITTYSDAIVSATNITALTALTNESLVNVLNTTNSIVSSSLVNYANVYLYATDGDITHDDITRFEIVPSEDVPHVVVSTAQYYPFENYILVSGSAFSYNSSVATIHVSAFDPSVDLVGQTETQIKDYIVANTTGTSLVVNQKIVGDFTNVEINSVFTDLVGGTTTMTDGIKYDLRVVLVDALGAKGMGHFVDKSGYLSVRDVDWSGVTADSPSYALNKATGAGGNYGVKCAISADGKIALITGFTTNAGCGYVWRYVEGTGWVEDSTNLNSSRIVGGVNGSYGISCALSADGNIAVISGTSTNSGCGYVWRYNETTGWVLDSTNLNSDRVTIAASGSVTGSYGTCCDISADGNVIIVSSRIDISSGELYVWRYNNATGWELDSTHLNSSRISSTVSGAYGVSCYLSSDGNIALVSGDNVNATSGCAYVWRFNESTGWEVDATNLNSSRIAATVGGSYGWSSAISADGNTVVVSVYAANSGETYIWRYDDTNGWEVDSSNLNSSQITGGVTGFYGYNCDISADGNTVLISGHGGANLPGDAYLWQYNGTTWTYTNISNTTAGVRYGTYCALSSTGGIALVSGNYQSDTTQGKAFIWQGTVDTNSPVTMIPFTTPSTFQSASTLRTTIESATLTDTLTFTGEVIPDSENLTTYYAMATTKDLTNSEARTMIVNPAYSTAVVTAVDVSTLTTLTDTLLDNVVDASDTVVPSNTVNYTNVYLYATDGDLDHDDIDVKVIEPADIPVSDYLEASVPHTSDNDIENLSYNTNGTPGTYSDTSSTNNVYYTYIMSLVTGTYAAFTMHTHILVNGDTVTSIQTGGVRTSYNRTDRNGCNLFGTTSRTYHSNGPTFVEDNTGVGIILYEFTSQVTKPDIYSIEIAGQNMVDRMIIYTKTTDGSLFKEHSRTNLDITTQTLYILENPILNCEEILFIFTHSVWVGFSTLKINSNDSSVYAGVDVFPHITISNVSDVQAGTPPTLTVDGSVFSSVADIASVKAMVFPSDADLTDETLVKAFIVANGTTIATTPIQNVVGQFAGIVMDKFYSSTDGYATGDAGAELVVGDKYVLRVISTDSLGNVGFNSYTTQATWWRIEYGISASASTNYYSRILELGLRDDITTLPSSGNTISPILRTSNLKDIYVWTRLPASANTLEIPNLFEQYNVNNTFGPEVNGTDGDVIKTIFDGSTSTTQQHMYGYNVTEQTDPNGKVRFDYEFTNPTDALEIVFTDGNDSTNGYQGGITSMSIYKSNTGGKNDNEWELHSTFDNYNNLDVIADSNTSSEGWDNTFAPKGLKVIQYNETTKQWEFKGLFVVS
ncbi:hypothetical protein QKU58_gp008 [Pyramimonas orientalis virus]|uniref:LamG-like jellyroll fold domain-containing protein n=1 Tax=Pyramimonas orientalis virus 01B TaxID=3134525 RepID=A0A7M4CEP4_9VIRU|nr:hypothetical protein QKU58_gp008 [Pyramimonas orientalis virus]QOI90146.1 hypothetical protein HWQ62_00008 [Pyramimonas orientalis virus]